MGIVTGCFTIPAVAVFLVIERWCPTGCGRDVGFASIPFLILAYCAFVLASDPPEGREFIWKKQVAVAFARRRG
jgi:hypothetical protein